MYHCSSLIAETLAIACPMTIAACSYTAKGPVQASQNTVVDRKSSPEGAYMQLLMIRVDTTVEALTIAKLALTSAVLPRTTLCRALDGIRKADRRHSINPL